MSNLPLSFSEEDVKFTFSKFGEVTESHLMVHDDGSSKGNALVTFTTREEALTAINTLKGTTFEGVGQPVVIKFANHSSIGGYNRGRHGGRGRRGRGRGGYNHRGSYFID